MRYAALYGNFECKRCDRTIALRRLVRRYRRKVRRLVRQLEQERAGGTYASADAETMTVTGRVNDTAGGMMRRVPEKLSRLS